MIMSQSDKKQWLLESSECRGLVQGCGKGSTIAHNKSMSSHDYGSAVLQRQLPRSMIR